MTHCSNIEELLEEHTGHGDWEEIYEECGDCGRWRMPMFTVFQNLNDPSELIGVEWDRVLTEMQENEFHFKPFAVKEHIEEIPKQTIKSYRPK